MMARAWVFGDNVSTDYIIPGRFNITNDPNELRKHVFKYVRPEFAGTVKAGDVVVGGNNFGCGSSREHAAIVVRESGVHLIAPSYGWIFRRNCINLGVLPLPSDGPVRVRDGAEVALDLDKGLLRDLETGGTFQLRPISKVVLDIHGAGGLVGYLNKYNAYRL